MGDHCDNLQKDGVLKSKTCLRLELHTASCAFSNVHEHAWTALPSVWSLSSLAACPKWQCFLAIYEDLLKQMVKNIRQKKIRKTWSCKPLTVCDCQLSTPHWCQMLMPKIEDQKSMKLWLSCWVICPSKSKGRVKHCQRLEELRGP